MNGTDEVKGLNGTFIAGGVTVTPQIFQQMIDSVGKNLEISAREATAFDSILATCAMTRQKPNVVIKKTMSEVGEAIVGGELNWADDSQIVTERGVFDVFEGKLYSYLFAIDVREKMVELFANLYGE